MEWTVIGIVVAGIAVLAIVDLILVRRSKPNPQAGELWLASLPSADRDDETEEVAVQIVRITGTTLMIRRVDSEQKRPEPLSASRLRRRLDALNTDCGQWN